MRVEVQPQAREQIREALRDLREARPSSVTAFREELREALERLERFPESGEAYTEPGRRNYRRALLMRFRHTLTYFVRENTVSVIAFRHMSMDPTDSLRAVETAEGGQRAFVVIEQPESDPER
jgi:plasmid stabilization system protein ParE